MSQFPAHLFTYPDSSILYKVLESGKLIEYTNAMSTPKYRLSYFNYRGGGEIVRLIFAVGNIEYEDERIEKEAWPDRKAGKADTL